MEQKTLFEAAKVTLESGCAIVLACRENWEEWLRIAEKEAPDHAEDWKDTSACKNCPDLDGVWCKLVDFPATVNPYLSPKTGSPGMACMGGVLKRKGKNEVKNRKPTCKHFNGVTNEKCKAGIVYDKIVGGYSSPSRKALPCIIFPDEKRERAVCECLEYLTMEELDAEEREVAEHFRKIAIARQAITEHMQGKFGGGEIQCPVCGTGKLSFVISEVNGHIHAKCTTCDCVAWME